MKRPCLDCGQPATGPRCPTHQRQQRAKYTTPAHTKGRAGWAPLVATGTVTCWRCGTTIPAGEPWDYGHTDPDSGYPTRWPEHAHCNRSAAALGH